MHLATLPPCYERVLAIVAHPDDAEIWAGGLLALAHTTSLMVLTGGYENGRISVRAREQQKSAKVLGIDDLWILSESDGFLIDSARLRHSILDWMRDVRPDLVLTHAPWDYHGDHRVLSLMVASVVNLTDKSFLSHVKPCPQPALWYFHSKMPLPFPHAERIVDIGSVMDVKERAVNCHRSQRQNYTHDYPSVQARDWAQSTPFDYAERFYVSPYGGGA